jgi:hypothetical protein
MKGGADIVEPLKVNVNIQKSNFDGFKKYVNNYFPNKRFIIPTNMKLKQSKDIGAEIFQKPSSLSRILDSTTNDFNYSNYHIFFLETNFKLTKEIVSKIDDAFDLIEIIHYNRKMKEDNILKLITYRQNLIVKTYNYTSLLVSSSEQLKKYEDELDKLKGQIKTHLSTHNIPINDDELNRIFIVDTNENVANKKTRILAVVYKQMIILFASEIPYFNELLDMKTISSMKVDLSTDEINKPAQLEYQTMKTNIMVIENETKKLMNIIENNIILALNNILKKGTKIKYERNKELESFLYAGTVWNGEWTWIQEKGMPNKKLLKIDVYLYFIPGEQYHIWNQTLGECGIRRRQLGKTISKLLGSKDVVIDNEFEYENVQNDLRDERRTQRNQFEDFVRLIYGNDVFQRRVN